MPLGELQLLAFSCGGSMSSPFRDAHARKKDRVSVCARQSVGALITRRGEAETGEDTYTDAHQTASKVLLHRRCRHAADINRCHGIAIRSRRCHLADDSVAAHDVAHGERLIRRVAVEHNPCLQLTEKTENILVFLFMLSDCCLYVECLSNWGRFKSN
jgi:hypothetical protein